MPSCIFFASEGFSLNSCGEISAGINEVVLPVLPITALTKELIGCIVVITPFVSVAEASKCKNKIVVKKTINFFMNNLFLKF